MHHILLTAISIQVLGNADFPVLQIYSRVFDGIETSFSFLIGEAYLRLTVSHSANMKKDGLISGALDTPSAKKVLVFFHMLHMINQLSIRGKSVRSVPYEKRSSFSLNAKSVLRAWTAGIKRGDPGL